jgi:hypothetical protein
MVTFRYLGHSAEQCLHDVSSHSALLYIYANSSIRFYGATSLNANRKLDRIRKLDEYRRQLLEGDPASLPEEERTRRNLLNLLLSPQPHGVTQQHHQQFASPHMPAYIPLSSNTGPTQAPTIMSRLSWLYHGTSAPHTPPTPHTPHTPSTPYTANRSSYLMSNYAAYSPPASTGLGIGGGDRTSMLQSPRSDRRFSRWALGRRATNTSTAYVSPTMAPPGTPSSTYTSIPSSEPASMAEHERENDAMSSRPDINRNRSTFMGMSATVGHGRERVGAGWTSWSPV